MWNKAKKEDSPEEALKEFRAIVDQEEEKGDWYVLCPPSILYLTHNPTGGSRPSNNQPSFSFCPCIARTMP